MKAESLKQHAPWLRLCAVLAAGLLVLAACGGDDSAAASDATAEARAAMAAWAVVFDSAAAFADKAAHLEDAANLEASNAAYAATGEGMGGISLVPTAAAADGDTAIITYNVLFGQSVAYSDLSGEINRVDGTWVVSRATHCGFLASARTPCE